jgi:ADP-heptose:LPS heptosyltransferase
MVSSKILAIKLRALGDTVLMTAPLLELIRAYPQAEIHVMVLKPWAPLLDGFPGIHKIWTYDPPKNKLKRSLSLVHMASSLRKEKFDSVINFHASPSSATLAYATGAQTRSIHFHGHHDKNKYSTVTIPGKGFLKPIIERDMDTVRALGIHVPAGRSPSLTLSSSETTEAENFLTKLNLRRPLLGISLGASRPTKSWPLDRFASLAIEWAKQEQGGVFAFAGPTETQEIHEFLKAVDERLMHEFDTQKARSEVRNSIAATNDIPLRKLVAIIGQLSTLACNDSGPKHIAAAINTPTVTLFGPEDPFEWHPYPKNNHPFLFVENLPCRKDADEGMPPWCGLHQCTTEDHRCMRMIGIDSVLKECQRVARNPKHYEQK